MAADPIARIAALEAAMHTQQSAIRGNTFVGGEPWQPDTAQTLSYTGADELDVSANLVLPSIITPSTSRLRIWVIGIFYIAANGGASADLSLTVREAGVRVPGALQAIGSNVYALPMAVSFDLKNLAGGPHTYSLGWVASDPANTRYLKVGPDRAAHFWAEARP